MQADLVSTFSFWIRPVNHRADKGKTKFKYKQLLVT